MELVASGCDCDVYAYGDGLVLRRYRDGRPAAAEAELIQSIHGLGYPVPTVVSVDGPSMVMQRIEGPSLADAMLSGSVAVVDGASLLARLLDELHALPWPGAQPLLHLDLHPLNVLLGPRGPVVIDWVNARPGPPGLDSAMTALLLAQIVVDPQTRAAVRPELAEFVTSAVPELLVAFAARTTPYLDHLDEAASRKLREPSHSAEEQSRVAAALEVARAAHPSI